MIEELRLFQRDYRKAKTAPVKDVVIRSTIKAIRHKYPVCDAHQEYLVGNRDFCDCDRCSTIDMMYMIKERLEVMQE